MATISKLFGLSIEEKAGLFDALVGILEIKVGDRGENSRKLNHKPKSSGMNVTCGKYEHPSSLTPEEDVCFGRLKKWRNQVATDMDWPAYMILDNKTLMSIAHYRPQNDEELLKIKGMGQEKLGRYCTAILDIVKEDVTYQRKLSVHLPEVVPRAQGSRRLGPNKLKYVPDDG